MFESVSTQKYRIPFLLKSLIFIAHDYFCYQTSILPANLIFVNRLLNKISQRLIFIALEHFCCQTSILPTNLIFVNRLLNKISQSLIFIA